MLSWCQTSRALLQLFVIFTFKLQLKQNLHIATVPLYFIWLSVILNKSHIFLPRSVTVYFPQVNGSHITCACISLCMCHVVIACKKWRMCGFGASIGGIMFIPSFLKNNALFEKLKSARKRARAHTHTHTYIHTHTLTYTHTHVHTHTHTHTLSLSLSLSLSFSYTNTHTYTRAHVYQGKSAQN